MKSGNVPDDAARIEALQRVRLRLHRLQPSRSLRDVRSAAAFIKERRIVLSTGRSSLPVLAESIAGRMLVVSWMADRASHRIYDLLGKLHKDPDVLSIPLILGKEALVHASLGSALERVTSDPGRRKNALQRLSLLAARLLRDVESLGQVRMDQWNAATDRGRSARLLLEREFLVFSKGLHTEHGYHTAIVMPWSKSKVSQRFRRAAKNVAYDDSVDQLLLAAIRSAVIVPEREARRWYTFGAERFDALIVEAKVERLTAKRASWLTLPQ